MNKSNLLFLFLFLLSIPLISAGEHQKTIKIGVIVPLSGDMAKHGIEIQRSMELAQANSNSKNYNFSLIFEDNCLQGVDSIAAAKRLIDIEKVDVIVTLWPPTANVVIPISEKNNVLHYTIAWDPNLAKDNRLVLSHQAMVNEIVRQTLMQFERRQIRKVAFLHLEEAGFNLGVSYFQKILPEYKV